MSLNIKQRQEDDFEYDGPLGHIRHKRTIHTKISKRRVDDTVALHIIKLLATAFFEALLEHLKVLL